MTDEIQYNLIPESYPLTILQGTTYYKEFTLQNESDSSYFPFFESHVALWKGRCMIKANFEDTVPLVTLKTDFDEEDGELELILDEDSSDNPFYAIYLPDTITSTLPAGTLLYDVEFERLSDGWVIRTQQGQITVSPEVTK